MKRIQKILEHYCKKKKDSQNQLIKAFKVLGL